MKELVNLENSLAEVLTVQDMAGEVLTRVAEVAGASASVMVPFGEGGTPSFRGGSLATVMGDYPPDLWSEDLLQSYSRTKPPGTFLAADRGDFDVQGHLRSRPYVDFYGPHDLGRAVAFWPTGRPF